MPAPAPPHHAARLTRAGFTLVELLVVISIIAMLLAIALPAINRAREQGHQVVCRGNLQNIGTAVGLYNSTYNLLPAAYMTAGGVTRSWVVMIMPQLDRNDIWLAASNNSNDINAYVSPLVCPSSPPDSTQQSWLSYAGATVAEPNTGNSTEARRAMGVMRDSQAMQNTSSISLDDVSAAGGGDGQATTLLLAEKCGPFLGTSGKWGSNTTAGSSSLSRDAIFWLPRRQDFTRVINSTSQSGANYISMPNSNHSGGAMVAFCDGHVEFLKESLQPHVYAQLMSWNHSVAIRTGDSPYSDWIKNGTAIYEVLNEGDYK